MLLKIRTKYLCLNTGTSKHKMILLRDHSPVSSEGFLNEDRFWGNSAE